jgi:hypothetical protein
MSFQILEGQGRTFWAQTDSASTYYMGQIVVYNQDAATNSINGTVAPLTAASGAADTTLAQVIAGVVVGFDDRTPTYDATTGLQTQTGSKVTQALQLARDWVGAEGMYVKGDPSAKVQIAEILPNTVIRGRIFNAAYGTAPTLLTVSATTDSDGLVTGNTTTNATSFTNVLNLGSIYCRSGRNAGLWRVSKDTSTTVPTVTTAFPYDVALGDTFVRVPFKQGMSGFTIPTGGLYVNCGANPVLAGTALFGTIVYSIDCRNAGSETVDFRFNNDHFCHYRA